jgi:hypothetical protein
MLPTPSVSALTAPRSARPQPTRRGARNDGHIGGSARTRVERLRGHPDHLRRRDADPERLWALDRQDTAVDSLFLGDNLEAWGWLYLIAGIVLVVIGVFIFRRATWAVLAGIAAAFLGAIVNLFWIFSYPLVSILAITLYLLAVYGLTTYSLEELD